MTFKERLLKAIAAGFGEDKKASDIESSEDKQKVADKYEEIFNAKLEDDFKSYQDSLEKAKQYDSALEVISVTEEKGNGESTQKPSNEGGKTDLGEEIKKITSENAELKKQNEENAKKIGELNSTVEKLSKETIPDNPQTKTVKITVNGLKHTEKHLFGVDHAMYALDKRWNKIMLNPGLAKTTEANEDEDFPAFQSEVKKFGASLAKRVQLLHANNLLNPEKLNAGLDVGYGDLTNAGLGEQFIVMRQDALIARIVALPNVYDIFSRRYGIEDRDLITNAFLGDASQAYQIGEVWKGSIDLQPEMGHVDDVMFKTLFNSMKWVERQYVNGYLNKEGSDTIKWTMIEWSVLQIVTKLTMESYKRRIMGVYSKPLSGTPGHFLHGSTGFVYTCIRYANEWKILPFSEAGLATYDDSTFLTVVENNVAKVRTVKEDFDESEYVVYLNKNHKQWYKDNFRTKYGTDNDIKAINDKTVQDTDMPIQWVPNMGQLKLIVIAKPGNFQALENLPGEMLNIKFLPDMETVKSWSVWKEGFSASFVNKQYTSLADITTAAFEYQEVFMNKPASDFTADDTTPSVAGNFWFKTVANAGATAITDFDDAKEGVGYLIEIGNATNIPTIAKAGVFSDLTAAFNPTAVGDNILLVYDKTNNKFYDLERTVGGVRTINPLKQPNLVGNGGR